MVGLSRAPREVSSSQTSANDVRAGSALYPSSAWVYPTRQNAEALSTAEYEKEVTNGEEGTGFTRDLQTDG